MGSVIAFTGLPGTGKSTLAEALATETGAPAFAGDWLLGALRPHGVLTGLSRPAFLAMYYDLLDGLIDDVVAERWQKTAAEYDARLDVIMCVCTDEVEHRRRLEGRTRGIPGWHEVGWDHVERMRVEFPLLTHEHLTVDALDPVDGNLRLVRKYISHG